MAATDRPSRRLLLGVAGLVALAVVALRADRADEVRALPPLPATSRGDLTLAVEAHRPGDGDGAVVALVLGVARTADDGLRLVDWGGDTHGWSVDGGWDASSPGWRWSPAVRQERGPGGSVVLHVGAGHPVDPEGLLRVQLPVDQVRAISPGREVEAEVRLDAPWPSTVRVCVWAADADPGDPGDRPAVCADDRLPER